MAVCFTLYLLASKKRSRAYRALLQQETEMFDALTTTGLLSKTMSTDISAGSDAGSGAGAGFDPRVNAGAGADVSTDLLTEAGTVLEDSAYPLTDNERTELMPEEQPEIIGFDASALKGRYILKKEIHGGGMSRVFLADSAKLGNQWIVKFISNRKGVLANEENILKLLNHISLPRIIDIFHDEKGVYIVQSYIEGVSLDKVLASGQKINQVVILDWAEQLAQVLGYLHRMKPHPIYHFDLKPSNIMVTHDNRLVLIDFGVSKRLGADDAAAVGITYKYAAPEQFRRKIPQKHMPMYQERFGALPPGHFSGMPDARSDIFSLGVMLFEFAVGKIPTVSNINSLKDAVSQELSGIISRCLQFDPGLRYQAVSELLADLQKMKGTKLKMARTLFMRKVASASAAFSLLLSGGSFGGGYYIYGQEAAALLDVRPEIVIVSLQQSSELTVEKRMPNGSIVLLDNSEVRWSYSQDNIVRIDGNRISGLNVGEAELTGRYRNKDISLHVRVIEPMDNLVEISQQYRPGRVISLFAGTSERDHTDGALADAEFVSPESIAVADDGTVYIADSGLLRVIKGGHVESVNFTPSYLMPNIIRVFKNDLYVLTHAWQDEEDDYYYGIIRLGGSGAEGIYIADARYTAVEDFAMSPDGIIYCIDRNEGLGLTSLKTIDPNNTGDIRTLAELPKGTSALTMDGNGTVYLANPETGAIQVYRDGVLSYFAGVENEKAFIDGTAPLFFMPQKIKYADGYLYVWDFNVLRRISIVGGVAAECITIAGEASPTFDLDITQTKQAAEEIILPNSRLMDFAVKDNGVLLTDPKRGVIWWVE